MSYSRSPIFDFSQSNSSIEDRNSREDQNLIRDPESLQKKAKKIERDLELMLNSISEDDNLEATYNQLRQIQALLNQLSDINERMSTKEMSVHIVQNHHEKLQHFLRTYQKAKERADERRNRELLLFGSGNRPTTENKVNSTSGDHVTLNMKKLMEERGSLFNSLATVDDIIEQATEAKNTVVGGRQLLRTTGKKLHSTGTTFTAVNTVLNSIKWKKWKNTIILGLVIGLCICFLLWWWLTSR